MGQKITLKLAGKEYRMEASSQEEESLFRRAAKDVTTVMSDMESRFPQEDRSDKLVFVAFFEAMEKLSSQEEKARLEGELHELEDEVAAYLKGIDNRK